MKNFLIFGKPFSEFYSGMIYNWDDYDLFNYASVYLDTLIFNLFNFTVSLENFLNYHTIIKLLIVIILFTTFRLFFNSITMHFSNINNNFGYKFFAFTCNSHHYFILFSLITFVFFYFKIPQNLYLKAI